MPDEFRALVAERLQITLDLVIKAIDIHIL
jgi:hypothetical protein